MWASNVIMIKYRTFYADSLFAGNSSGGYICEDICLSALKPIPDPASVQTYIACLKSLSAL